METWKKFPRAIFLIILLTSLLAGVSAPVLGGKSVSAAPMQANALDVIISEVAWGGTATSATDEWIELYNSTSSTIDLSGWTLVSNDASPSINLAGSIPAGGYYLLERDDDNTISDIPADQIYTGNLNNNPSGEILTLKDNSPTPNVIDTANSITTAWDGGSNAPGYFSMERIGVVADSDTAWKSNDGVTRNGWAAGGILAGCTPNVTCTTNPPNINGTPKKSSINLSLSMAVDDSALSTGGNTVIFTITVTNSGQFGATNVKVMDLLPAGLTYQSDNGAGAYIPTTGNWTVPTVLLASNTVSLDITATVDTVGIKTNRAEILSFDQLDPNSIPGNNSTTEDDDDSKNVSLPGASALVITNIVNNPSPNVGTNVVFTIKVSNGSATINASGVSVSAPIPSGLKYISYSSTSGSYVSGIWSIVNLATGSSATLTVTAQVISTNPSSFSATVSSNEFANSTATATITNPLSGEADLTLTHDPLTISTSVTDQVNLKLRLHNAGPDKATNVQVRDILPDGLDYVSYTSSLGSYNSGTGIWAISEIASGADATLTIAVTVASSGTSTKNFAEVWDTDQFDSNSIPGNGAQTPAEDDETSLEVPVADLSVSEAVTVAGSNAVFRITVRNDGPDDASGIIIKSSKLGTSYTYVSHGSTAGTYNSASGDWTIPTLLDGVSATLTVTTTFSGSLSVNWAQVFDADQVDPDSAPNNCAGTISSCTEDDDAGSPAADLFLTQSVNNSNPNVGENVIFTITVHNAGIAGTTSVEVKSILPSGLTYVSNDQDTAYNKTSGIWTVGTLDSGASKTLNITTTVATQGIKTNLAEVWKSDQDDPDSIPANNSTSEDDDASAAITSYRSIIINEVAWSGTAASEDDEWLELYNPSSSSINVTGWTLKSASGYINITLSGTINSGGYFLLERDDNSTVSDIAANQIYTGALSDSGEVLTLLDGSGNFIDTANGNGGAWPKGSSSSTFGSMERLGTTAESDKTWVTNVGSPKTGLNAANGAIYGTPKRANSVGLSPTPTARSLFPQPTVIPLVGRPIINEFLARPGFDWNQDGKVDVFDEFIEIKNIGNTSISLSGWKLDDEQNQGSSEYLLPAVTLNVGERMIFYGLQTNILLSDGGDTVRLLNSSNKVYDAYTYAIAKVEDQSVCRLPDGNGSWYEDCVPTPNLINSREGKVPSMPGGGSFESPVCDLPDTLPADFLFAECRGYGADIWHSFYWDQLGWQGDRSVLENMSKWESFVE